MDALVLALSLLLAGVFAVAGVAKLMDLAGSRQALEDFGVPARLARPGGLLLPLAEIAIAVVLVFPASARWGAVAAAVLLGVFVVAIANALRQGRAPDCHCFGQVHSEPAGRGTLARNAILIAVAGAVAGAGPGPAVHTWVSDRSALELVAVAIALAAAAVAARMLHRWRDDRRRKAAILRGFEAKFGTSGLPLGSPAPDFTLSEMGGDHRTLGALCDRGLPVVLVFVHPECGPCRSLLPKLADWRARLARQVTIAVLSEGGADENKPLQEEYGLGDLLLQERGEVYQAYGLHQGTPSAVVVGPDRRIASVGAAGDFAVEELIRLTLRHKGSPPHPSLAA
jgi:uncharacterized membrane protein YphA (DoxX/SURF4 family)/thiol-disulfide isomerase/thioredoxin